MWLVDLGLMAHDRYCRTFANRRRGSHVPEAALSLFDLSVGLVGSCERVLRARPVKSETDGAGKSCRDQFERLVDPRASAEEQRSENEA